MTMMYWTVEQLQGG